MTEPPPTPSDGVAFDFDRSGRVTNLRLAPDWHVSTPPALLGMTLTAQLHQHSLGRSLEAATVEPWPAPYAFIGGGSPFREGT